jgi:hypothetical protein
MQRLWSLLPLAPGLVPGPSGLKPAVDTASVVTQHTARWSHTLHRTPKQHRPGHSQRSHRGHTAQRSHREVTPGQFHGLPRLLVGGHRGASGPELEALESCLLGFCMQTSEGARHGCRSAGWHPLQPALRPVGYDSWSRMPFCAIQNRWNVWRHACVLARFPSLPAIA